MYAGQTVTPLQPMELRLAHDGMIWVHPQFRRRDQCRGRAGKTGEDPRERSRRIDPKTEKLEVFQPDAGIAGANISIDEDGRGNIWASTGRGAVRFDPRTKKFRNSSRLTQPGGSYGMTGDRDGNGWWTQISSISWATATWKPASRWKYKVPPNTKNAHQGRRSVRGRSEKLTVRAEPGREAPRRLVADRNSDDVWIPDYSGNNLLRINTHTLKTTFYPAPRPGLESLHGHGG